jgi:ATP-dependent exoDNAse (exonuclease V) alpha subunit
VVRREPYRLAADVWGIGFKTADQLARSLGIPHHSPQRVKAGLQFALSQAAEDGHCYLPETELVAKATGLLEVEGGLTSRCLEELIQEEGVVAEPLPTAPQSSIDQQAPRDRAIWLVPFHCAEVALAGLEAATLHRLLQLRPGGDAAVDRDHPLDADLVVVDEASMLDVLLANKLVKPSPRRPPAVCRRRRSSAQRRRRGGAAGFAGRRAAAPGAAHPMCSARPSRAG